MRRFRCPICGHIVSELNLPKVYPIGFFDQHGLGYGKGFVYVPVVDAPLLSRLKNKIAVVYHALFSSIIPVEAFALCDLKGWDIVG